MKASDNPYPSVLFDEQAGAPTTPAAGNWRAYFKASGLFVVDDAGVEVGPLTAAGTDDQTAAEVPITDAGAYFTGTNVEAALQEVGADVAALSGGGGGGGLLAVVQYRPGSATDVPTTGTTLTAVDATNLSVTFTAPASGKVLVRLSSTGYANATTSHLMWGVLDSGGAVVYAASYVTQSASQQAHHRSFLVTGLTASASYTYRFAHARSAATNGSTRYGGNDGPAVIEVWEAP